MEGRTKINLGGVDYPLMFGYLATKSIKQDKNLGALFNEDGSPTEIGYAKIVYSGHQNHCFDRNTTALPFGQFVKLFDELISSEEGVQIVADILKVWFDSEDVQDLIKKSEKKSQEQTAPDPSTLPPSSELPTGS